MSTRTRLALMGALVGSLVALPVSLSLARQSAQPAPVEGPKPAEAQTPVAVKIASTDADVLAAVKALTGSFRAEATGATGAAIDLHAVPINVEGLDNALYFELARADAPQAPFRQGVIHFVNVKGGSGASGLRLRVLELDKFAVTFANALVGMWLAPEMMPAIRADQLSVNSEIPLTRDGDRFKGTASMIPTQAGGAVYFASTIEFGGGSIRWADKGIDADGKQVWGPASDADALAFKAFTPASSVKKLDGNLIVIDLVPGASDKPEAKDGSRVSLHYTGWTLADGNKFDSSRDPGRDPFTLTLPLSLIQGWNQGVPGIKEGAVRRLIIPANLGYGERGNARARIAPGATLVFDIECLFHQPGEPPKAPAPAPTPPPAPTPAPAPKPAQ
jgi:FKBP-type peptidyl-prolyl cis-trans isomerase FkpA